ncbi:MAG: hypothetical protein NZ700_15770 [Gemmataceae bacterium]|nr:hypothetical protein [Gemmataceae bacterium]MDW8267481.1 hypothetical protein [Gemmataceae bacterium]
MRSMMNVGLFAVTLVTWAAYAANDQAAEELARQKESVKANWLKVVGKEANLKETDNLLLVAPLPEEKLDALGASYEKQLAVARKALQIQEPLWKGKLAVYVFPERFQFSSFVRSVEKRRPEVDDLSSSVLSGDLPHVAAGPAPDKGPTAEQSAGYELATALLSRKVRTDLLPGWLVEGFGRATAWRANPTAYASERALVRKLVKVRSARDVWEGRLPAAEATVLRASLVDFLAYGPGAGTFLSLLNGFKPGEGEEMRSFSQAMEYANISPERLDKEWRAWAAR